MRPREVQVLLAREALVQEQLLRQHADQALDREQVGLERQPFDHDRAARRPQQSGQHLDGGALAGPVRAQEAEETPARDAHAEVGDGRRAAEQLGQPAHADRVARHRVILPKLGP
jgi:hypothetical protein